MNPGTAHEAPISGPVVAQQLRLTPGAQSLLRCPVCHARLVFGGNEAVCQGGACAARYPVIDGIPVLLNEANSIFSFSDFVQQRNTTFDLERSWQSRLFQRLTPSISRNMKSRQNYRKLGDLLLAHPGREAARPYVLVLGGSVLGQGMEDLVADSGIDFIESDVSFGPRAMLICDGHDIPLADGAVDAVVVQAVLEHVLDPYRVVDEIHRVLAPDGLVYAETPFMQQMHGGRYDFTRFSYWGHRRLFRWFDEVDSGIVCGPGMALAWSYSHFLLSFVRSRWARFAVNLFTAFTAFFWKYFDGFLVDRPGALKAASGYFFLGRRSDSMLSDQALVKTYKPEISGA